MTKTFKVLSALLSYPTEELRAAARSLRAALQEESLVPGFDTLQGPLTPALSPRGEGVEAAALFPGETAVRTEEAKRAGLGEEGNSGAPSPLPYPLADMAHLRGNLAKARLREKGRIRGDSAKGPAAALLRLIEEIENSDLFDLQERYILLFDRTRSLSLHLFEHIHGESRDRGQALVDLAQLYERHGLQVEAKELSDFLPLFLEFLSTLPLDEARALLAEPLHIVAALGNRLRKRQSSYASVFWALEAIANAKPSEEGLKALCDEDDSDPNDLEALDKAWAEDPVTFGPAAAEGGCSSGRAATRIRAALRPAPETSPLPKR